MPWNPTTQKSVTAFTHGTQGKNRSYQLATAPPVPTNLQFSGIALFASIARTNALLGATPNVTQGLARSAGCLICEVVEDPPTLFLVTADVDHFADAKRTSFSGDIGAGVTDLVMDAMGYVYRANARTIIPTGPAADFVYIGRPTGGQGIGLAAAKGRVSASTTPNSLLSAVRQGYQTQVEPHVGTAPGGAPILHGYAIGLGTKPGGGKSFIHIEETAPILVPVAPGGGGGSPGAS